MFRCFFPDEYVDSTYVIDFEKLYQEGYRGLIFDIDNTLVPHGAPADTRAIALFRRLKKLGFGCCLLSNNQKKRVASFNDAVQVNYIENAHKPSVRNYNRAMEILGTNTENTIFIGDQLYRCIRSQESRHPQYSGQADRSERRNPDRAQALSGKNSTILL